MKWEKAKMTFGQTGYRWKTECMEIWVFPFSDRWSATVRHGFWNHELRDGAITTPDEAREAIARTLNLSALPEDVRVGLETRIEPPNPWRDVGAGVRLAQIGQWHARVVSGVPVRAELSMHEGVRPIKSWRAVEGGLPQLRRITEGCTAIPAEVHAMLAVDPPGGES